VPYAALATRWCRNADWVGPNQHGGHRGGDTAQSADWLSGMLVSPCERLDIGFMVWAVERGWSLGFGARDCNLVGVGFGCVYSQGVSPPHTFIIITIADSKVSNIFIASEHYTSTTPYQPQTITSTSTSTSNTTTQCLLQPPNTSTFLTWLAAKCSAFLSTRSKPRVKSASSLLPKAPQHQDTLATPRHHRACPASSRRSDEQPTGAIYATMRL
jgi:hypothetical protein